VTPGEADAGFGSAFSSYTAGGLRGASIEGGVATLDLTTGFVATNNFSTSTLATIVMSQIEATVFQFDDLTGLELTVDGERWCGWEATCHGQPVPLREGP
jgi:spore germination protein GerM